MMKMRQIGLTGIVVLLLCIVSSKAVIGSNHFAPYRLSFMDKIFALYVLDEKTYWAVGDMITTADGGKTWVKVEGAPSDKGPLMPSPLLAMMDGSWEITVSFYKAKMEVSIG